jgi:hypothetical protein
MATYRFRVKLAADPQSLWRDITIGAERTVDEFQTTLNDAVGLDQGHLWFVGRDQDYWESDIKFQPPSEYEESPSGGRMGNREETYNAGRTPMGELTAQLGLDEGDRICYLYDYGDEWRFYAILKEATDDGPSDSRPQVVNEKGDGVVQYPPESP